MTHPYASSVRTGNKAKYKALTGKKGGGQVHPDEGQDRKLFHDLMVKHEKAELKSLGKASGGRLDKYARGGKVKPKININIISVPHGESPATPPPLPPAMGLPGRPPMAGPPVPPGAPSGPAIGPGAMPMKKSGGSISGLSTKENIQKWAARAERNHKASGGKVTGQKGGSETGVGRLDKVKMQKKK
jgi:hypothetical protein